MNNCSSALLHGCVYSPVVTLKHHKQRQKVPDKPSRNDNWQPESVDSQANAGKNGKASTTGEKHMRAYMCQQLSRKTYFSPVKKSQEEWLSVVLSFLARISRGKKGFLLGVSFREWVTFLEFGVQHCRFSCEMRANTRPMCSTTRGRILEKAEL